LNGNLGEFDYEFLDECMSVACVMWVATLTGFDESKIPINNKIRMCYSRMADYLYDAFKSSSGDLLLHAGFSMSPVNPSGGGSFILPGFWDMQSHRRWKAGREAGVRDLSVPSVRVRMGDTAPVDGWLFKLGDAAESGSS
jgi:hypothetical protein